MTYDEAKIVLTDLYTQKKSQNESIIFNNQKEQEALALVLDLFSNNVQTLVDTGVQSVLAAKVQEATAPLQDAVNNLKIDNQTKQARIDVLNKWITDNGGNLNLI
jgi:hypothetical protein